MSKPREDGREAQELPQHGGSAGADSRDKPDEMHDYQW
jgi:hypothetical protein